MALNLTGLQDILWLRMKGASTCSFKSPILIVIMSLEKSETPETEKNLCSVITHTLFLFKTKIMYDFQTIWSAKICLITCEIGEEIIDIKACEEKKKNTLHSS